MATGNCSLGASDHFTQFYSGIKENHDMCAVRPCVLPHEGGEGDWELLGQTDKVNNASSTSLYFVIKWLDLKKWRMGCNRLTSARLPAPSHNLPCSQAGIRVAGGVPHKSDVYLVGYLGLEVMPYMPGRWCPVGSQRVSPGVFLVQCLLMTWEGDQGLQVYRWCQIRDHCSTCTRVRAAVHRDQGGWEKRMGSPCP